MNAEIRSRLEKFPRTRFMGSKQKLLQFIYENIKDMNGEKFLDAFSGSACVAYLFKAMGKEVHTNDFLRCSYIMAQALVENNKVILTDIDIQILLQTNDQHSNFISKTFKDLYFNDSDNLFLDQTYANIQMFKDEYKKSLALAALARACIKKRPRGIFTYVGDRYDDGRRDIHMPLQEQFIESVKVLNDSIFDNGCTNKAFNLDIFQIPSENYDVVYIDPPYCSLHSDNDYSRRYHFIEGLMTNWSHVAINHFTKTKKIKKFSTPFESKRTVYHAFDKLFSKFQKSSIVVSYSSNSLPTLNQMLLIMKKYKSNVRVAKFDHKYSFGTQKANLKNNKVEEYLFIGTD